MNNEQIKNINAICSSLESIRATIKQLEAQKDVLEGQLLELKHSVTDEKTLKTDRYSVTEKPTNTYELSDEGYNVVASEQGFDSACFSKPRPVLKVIRELGKYDQYITCNEGKPSITLKKIVQG